MKIGIAGAGAGKTTAMADTIIQFRSKIEDYVTMFLVETLIKELMKPYEKIRSLFGLKTMGLQSYVMSLILMEKK